MPTGTVAPFPFHQFFDANGDPLNGGKLFTYEAGTTTKLASYTDSALSVAHANPIVLSSAGRPSSPIYLSPKAYKFVLTTSSDTDPPASPLWTADNVHASAPFAVDLDIEGTAGEALSANDCVYLSDGSGGNTAGRWYKADADFDYSSITANAVGVVLAAISSGSSGSIRLHGRLTGFAGLTPGTVYYISATAGAVTSSAPTRIRPVAIADSTTSLVVSQWLTAVAASATMPGVVTTGAQTFAGVKSFNDHPRFEPGTSSGTYANANGRLHTDTTVVGNVGGGTDDLMTYSLPANVLDVNGKAVRITAWGRIANNANAKTVALLFGATTLVSEALTTNQDGRWWLQAHVVRTGAATQEATVVLLAAPTSTGGVTDSRTEDAQPAETLTGAITVKCTGAATSDNDITQRGLIVEVVG